MGELYDERPDDIEGLDASAAHIANLLSTEPAGGEFLCCYINFSQYLVSLVLE